MLSFLILALNSAQHVSELLAAVYRPSDVYAVHMDAKAPLRERAKLATLCRRFSNVRLLDSRFCSWAGFSLVETMLDGVETLLRADDRWSHFVLLSEQHYPLREADGIESALAAETSYMDAYPYVTHSVGARNDIKQRFSRVYTEMSGIGSFGGPPREVDLSHVYHGSQWVVLSRRACEFLVRSRLDAAKWDLYSTSLLPDETAVPSILMNATADERGNVELACLTYVAWPHLTDNGDLIASPLTFEKARETSSLFIRKRPGNIDDFHEYRLLGRAAGELLSIGKKADVDFDEIPPRKDRERISTALRKSFRALDCVEYEPGRFSTNALFGLRRSVWDWRLSVMIISRDFLEYMILINLGPSHGGFDEVDVGAIKGHVMRVRVVDLNFHYQAHLEGELSKSIKLANKADLASVIDRISVLVEITDRLNEVLPAETAAETQG